jgi:hypothetical protein
MDRPDNHCGTWYSPAFSLNQQRRPVVVQQHFDATIYEFNRPQGHRSSLQADGTLRCREPHPQEGGLRPAL